MVLSVVAATVLLAVAVIFNTLLFELVGLTRVEFV
jgi:hypothetical protein